MVSVLSKIIIPHFWGFLHFYFAFCKFILSELPAKFEPFDFLSPCHQLLFDRFWMLIFCTSALQSWNLCAIPLPSINLYCQYRTARKHAVLPLCFTRRGSRIISEEISGIALTLQPCSYASPCSALGTFAGDWLSRLTSDWAWCKMGIPFIWLDVCIQFSRCDEGWAATKLRPSGTCKWVKKHLRFLMPFPLI